MRPSMIATSIRQLHSNDIETRVLASFTLDDNQSLPLRMHTRANSARLIIKNKLYTEEYPRAEPKDPSIHGR